MAALTALVFMTLIYTVPDCQPVRHHTPIHHNGENNTDSNITTSTADVEVTTLATEVTSDKLNNEARVRRHVPSEHASHNGFLDDFEIGINGLDTNESQHNIYGYYSHGFIIQVCTRNNMALTIKFYTVIFLYMDYRIQSKQHDAI